MAATRIKVVKKNAEKKEEILSLSERSREWVEEHYIPLLVGMGLILLIPIVFWGFSAYGEASERRARGDYAQVMSGWPDQESSDPGAWEKVGQQLEKFINEHQGTVPALNAQMDLARVYVQMRRYEDALIWSQKALSQIPAGSELKPLARYQLAQTYETSGRFDEALQEWNALRGELAAGVGREIDWQLARLYTKKGDYPKAAEQYERALQAPGSYPASNILQEELALVRVKLAGTESGGSKAEAPGKAP